MWEPQLRTPGIVRSSRQARTETRTSSGPDVSGEVSQCIRKSRSLKLGSSDWPRNGTTASPATTVAATVAYAQRGLRDDAREHAARSRAAARRTSGDRRRSSGAFRSRIRASAGVTVSATTSEAPTARMYEKARGLKNAPVRPVRKKTGIIAATMISVA